MNEPTPEEIIDTAAKIFEFAWNSPPLVNGLNAKELWTSYQTMARWHLAQTAKETKELREKLERCRREFNRIGFFVAGEKTLNESQLNAISNTVEQILASTTP